MGYPKPGVLIEEDVFDGAIIRGGKHGLVKEASWWVTGVFEGSILFQLEAVERSPAASMPVVCIDLCGGGLGIICIQEGGDIAQMIEGHAWMGWHPDEPIKEDKRAICIALCLAHDSLPSLRALLWIRMASLKPMLLRRSGRSSLTQARPSMRVPRIRPMVKQYRVSTGSELSSVMG